MGTHGSESWVRRFRPGLYLLGAILVGCGAETPDAPTDRLATEEASLWGPTVRVEDNSTAQNLTTIEGVAGTIVYLTTGDSRCSGTLVRRDRVLTAAHCVETLPSENPGISVGFRQDPLRKEFGASRYWTNW